MPEKALIIVASARKASDTRKFTELVFADTEYAIVDLLDLRIASYNYEHRYPEDDDFLRLIDEMSGYRLIVFATPVYWYAMSGILKNFLDRLTELVTLRKQLGRQLKGKSVFLLAVGADAELPEGFEVPFKRSCEYLDMTYGACIYCPTGKLGVFTEPEKSSFIATIRQVLRS